jgi:hypothetical protein
LAGLYLIIIIIRWMRNETYASVLLRYVFGIHKICTEMDRVGYCCSNVYPYCRVVPYFIRIECHDLHVRIHHCPCLQKGMTRKMEEDYVKTTRKSHSSRNGVSCFSCRSVQPSISAVSHLARPVCLPESCLPLVF